MASAPQRSRATAKLAAEPSAAVHLPLAAALALLLFLRKPESLLHPQFWAEDGQLFFQQAWNQGFLATLLEPMSGYLHTFPRLVAGISTLLPLSFAPIAFNLAAFVVQLLPALYLLSARLSSALPLFPARALAALLWVVLPNSYETHANLTNSHWHLAIATVLILVASPAGRAAWLALDGIVLVLFALTGPFSFLLLPPAIAAFRGAGGFAARGRELLPSIVILAGGIVQAGFALASLGSRPTVAVSSPISVGEVTTIVSLHAVFTPLLGINGFSRIFQGLPAAVSAAGLLAPCFLLFIAAVDRAKLLLLLGYLSVVTIVLSLAFPLNDLRLWLAPAAGPRYFLFATLFLLLASLHLALSRRPARYLGVLLLAPAFAWGIPADFLHPKDPDVHWADQVAAYRSLPAGSELFIPVVPLYHGGMVLQKRTPEVGAPPLAGMQPVASPAPAFFEVTRPGKVTLNEKRNDTYVMVAGWAVDPQAAGAAGGVFVKIGERIFPAVTGLASAVEDRGLFCGDCGFTRIIPRAEIGPGMHQASIIVVARDRKGYYLPSPPRAFDLDRLFDEIPGR